MKDTFWISSKKNISAQIDTCAVSQLGSMYVYMWMLKKSKDHSSGTSSWPGLLIKKDGSCNHLEHSILVKIGGVAVYVDPELLFQKLTVAANASHDLASSFKYEMYSHPPALFDTSLTLRQPQKPVLLTPDLTGIIRQVQYVLDGGALGIGIQWTRGATYNYIMQVVHWVRHMEVWRGNCCVWWL